LDGGAVPAHYVLVEGETGKVFGGEEGGGEEGGEGKSSGSLERGGKDGGSAVERGVIALCDVPVVPFAPSRRPEEKVGIFLDALVAALDCSAASKNLIDNAVYLRVASTREIE
jgi:hypothetical protein